MKQSVFNLLAFLLLFAHGFVARGQSFVHPGILHSREDLERMKKAVADKEEPVYAGYQLFLQNPASQYDYKMQGPLAMVGRNPTVGQGTYDSDANAAHQNAVLWAITGDKRHADKAIEIINAWSRTLQSITGRDAVLMAGLGPFKMVNAAEIVRYTNAGWPEAAIQQTEKHFKEVIYPVLKDFAPFANGNWDAAAIKTVMAIAVFCNDRSLFESALRYYVHGHGNGRLTNYVINEEGQIQESGRDQGHTQLGIGMLAESCAIAWNQGLDLYGYADNRLLKGFEYVAKFNLGNEVPFTEWLDRTGKYHHKAIARQDRGPLRAVYEQVYNHYVNRMGLSAPFTQQAAEKLRPEGPGKPGADHPGYGTLYFTRPKGLVSAPTMPAQPGALIAVGKAQEITISWVKSIGATGYTIKRSEKSGGVRTVVARNINGTTFTDTKIRSGTIYYYTVSAANAKGESADAYETAVAAGLPSSWKQHSIGSTWLQGITSFDGKVFTVEGAGMGVDSTAADEAQFTYHPLKGDGEITMRFVPQPSSQSSRMGITIRDGLGSSARHVSLLIYPGRTAQIEAPNWQVRLITRTQAGERAEIKYAAAGLIEPAVTFGRLTGYYWLRLQRKGNRFSGSTSYDGKIWTEAGSVSIPLAANALFGFSVASGIPNTTTVFFDHVTIHK